MITKLWIYPPLAIARLGNSDTPLETFFWGPNDDTPAGTGKTTILPAETLTIAADGTVSSFVPETINFKDEDGFRPVCPFFERHAEWDGPEGPEHGPLTPAVLERFGLSAASLRWTVEVANLKPFFMTQDGQNRIHARVELRGDDVTPRTLLGTAPSGAPNPLVPEGRGIPFGVVRLTRPTPAFPEFRLRFIPGQGKFYGPTNFPERWPGVTLPPEQLFLNTASSWCSWKPADDDMRGVPGGQYAQDANGVSLGLVDDVCDGLVSCAIDGVSVGPAHARVTVGPPDYAPDRRHPVSLADGLKDRVDRADVFDPGYVDAAVTSREILDLLERVWETMARINLDAFNDRVDVQENPNIALVKGVPYRASDRYAFDPPAPIEQQPLPLTALGRRDHRRFVAMEAFLDLLRMRPELIDQWVREPVSARLFFDRKMPALMRGSSGDPLTLTRRQYDLLVRWVQTMVKPREART